MENKKHTRKHKRKRRVRQRAVRNGAVQERSTLSMHRKHRRKKKGPKRRTTDRSMTSPAIGSKITSIPDQPLLRGSYTSGADRTYASDTANELSYQETLTSEKFQNRLTIHSTTSELGTKTVPFLSASGDILAKRETKDFLATSASDLHAQTRMLPSSANVDPAAQNSALDQLALSSMSELSSKEFASKHEYPASKEMPTELPTQDMQKAVEMEVSLIDYPCCSPIDPRTPRRLHVDAGSQQLLGQITTRALQHAGHP